MMTTLEISFVKIFVLIKTQLPLLINAVILVSLCC